MSVPENESAWSGIFVMGIDFDSLYDFLFDFGIVPTVKHFLFFILLGKDQSNVTSIYIFVWDLIYRDIVCLD